MNLDLEHIPCNLCGGSQTRLYAKISYRDYLDRRPELLSQNDPILKSSQSANYKFNLVQCKSCELVYVNPRLSQKSLGELYKDDYFTNYSDTLSDAHRKRQVTFKTEIIELEKIVKSLNLGKKILDLGCGGGFFLASLDSSWKKHGTEINPVAVKYARETFGFNIIESELKYSRLAKDEFDIVKMRGVIEHMPDPLAELRKVHRILRKGGLLAINTPNIGSICGKLYKEKFRMINPVQHIYYFSTKTLKTMLAKIGFKVVKVSYHYFDTPYVSRGDFLKLISDILFLNILRKHRTVSPPFYGNIVDIYGVKQ